MNPRGNFACGTDAGVHPRNGGRFCIGNPLRRVEDGADDDPEHALPCLLDGFGVYGGCGDRHLPVGVGRLLWGGAVLSARRGGHRLLPVFHDLWAHQQPGCSIRPEDFGLLPLPSIEVHFPCFGALDSEESAMD